MKAQEDIITIALAELARQGFTIDYNLSENLLIGSNNQADITTFSVSELYHYEITSVSGEDVYIFALKSESGEQGFFVYGRQPVNSPHATLIFAELLMSAERQGL